MHVGYMYQPNAASFKHTKNVGIGGQPTDCALNGQIFSCLTASANLQNSSNNSRSIW